LVNKSAASLNSLERTKTATPAWLISNSKPLNKYIKSIGAMNRRTAYEYYTRLTGFQDLPIITMPRWMTL